MLHWSPLLMTGLVALLAVACDDEPAGPEPVFSADWATAYVQVRDCRLSIEHELDHMRVLADPASAARYRRCVTPELPCNEPFPAGAVIVKAQYRDADCTDLRRITAVRREPEAPAEAGGWRWQAAGADGAVTEDGSLRSCVGCHRGCDPAYDLMCSMDP